MSSRGPYNGPKRLTGRSQFSILHFERVAVLGWAGGDSRSVNNSDGRALTGRPLRLHEWHGTALGMPPRATAPRLWRACLLALSLIPKSLSRALPSGDPAAPACGPAGRSPKSALRRVVCFLAPTSLPRTRRRSRRAARPGRLPALMRCSLPAGPPVGACLVHWYAVPGAGTDIRCPGIRRFTGSGLVLSSRTPVGL